MKWWLTELDTIGYGAFIHAIGDGAVHESLNAIDAARKNHSEQLYTLTHLEMVEESDISRFASLGVEADFQVGEDFLGNPNQSWASDYLSEI